MKTISTTIVNGVQTVFPVSFGLGYIDRAHVYVYTGSVYTQQIGYTWINSTTIETAQVLPSGTELTIRRVIPKAQLINDYTNAAILEEQNLDNSFKQALMWLEEIEDGFMSSDDAWIIRNKIKFLGDLDMDGFRIKNLPQPVDSTDAARVQDVLQIAGGVAGANYIGETAPVTVFNGMRWYNPTIPTTFTYYIDGDSGQWVEETVQGVDGKLRQDLADANSNIPIAGIPAKAFRTISGIKDLMPIEHVALDVVGFYSGTTTGGGKFTYKPNMPVSAHNGGTIIAAAALGAWDGTQTGVNTLLTWAGTGTGCYVRTTGYTEKVLASWFGLTTVDNGNVLANVPDVTASLSAAIRYCNSRYVEITNEGYFGSTNFNLVLPRGYAKTSSVIQFLRGMDIRSEGTTFFSCATPRGHSFMDCLTERLFDFTVEGIKLQRYTTCYRVKNDDVTDHSQWRFKRCGFKDVALGIDTVSYVASRSTILTLEDCKSSYGVEEFVRSYCDMTHVIGGWYTHDQNKPCFTIGGRATVTGGIYVPILAGPHNALCWYSAELADESAGIVFSGCRFGGEYGGGVVLYVKSNAAASDNNGLASGASQQFTFTNCQLSSNNPFDPLNTGTTTRAVVVFNAYNNGGVSFQGCTISTDLGPAATNANVSRVIAEYNNLTANPAPHNFVIEFDDTSWRAANNGANRPATNKLLQYVGNAAQVSMFKETSAYGHLLVGVTTDGSKNKATFKVKLGRRFTYYTFPMLFDLDVGQLGQLPDNAYRTSRYAGYRCSIVGGRDLGIAQNVYKLRRTLMYAHDGGVDLTVGAEIVSMHFGTGDTGQDYVIADGIEPDGEVYVTVVWGEFTQSAATGLARVKAVFDQFAAYNNGNDVP